VCAVLGITREKSNLEHVRVGPATGTCFDGAIFPRLPLDHGLQVGHEALWKGGGGGGDRRTLEGRGGK